MNKKVYVEYNLKGKRPILQFRGKFTKENISNIFLNRDLGLVPYTQRYAIKNHNGEVSFVAENSARAKDITKKLTPLLEQQNYELVLIEF